MYRNAFRRKSCGRAERARGRFFCTRLLDPYRPERNRHEYDTAIYGVDVYLKGKPQRNQRSFPFLAWQTEVLARNYETPADTLEDNAVTSSYWGL